MRARDVMTTSVVTVSPGTSAKEAADLLVRKGFTTLPVVDAGRKLVGIVTEADILKDRIAVDPRALVHPDWPVHAANGPAPPTVGAVMTKDVVALEPGADAAQVAREMLDRHLRSIPIVDGDRLVGIVSRWDLLRTIARDDELILLDVRQHLTRCFRRGDWSATVADGVVTLVDEYGNDEDSHVATVVASAVPGVIDVQVVTPAR